METSLITGSATVRHLNVLKVFLYMFEAKNGNRPDLMLKIGEGETRRRLHEVGRDMTTPLEDLVQVSEGATHSPSSSVSGLPDGPVDTPTVSRPSRSPAKNIFLHWSRGAFRVAALLATDMTAFMLIRTAVRALRSGALSGYAVSPALVNIVFPKGFLHVGQFIAALIIGLTLSGSYGAGDARRDSARLFAGAGLAALLTFYGSFLTEPFWPVLLQVVVMALVFGVTLTALRLIVDRIAAVMGTGPPPARTIVILGRSQSMGAASDVDTIFHSGPGFEVVETFRVQLGNDLGPSLAEAIDSQGVDTVAMIGRVSEASYSEIFDVSTAHGCKLITTPRATGVVPRSVVIDGVRLVELTAPGLKAPQLVAKRFIDIVISLIGLFILSPIIVGLALWVRQESEGGAWFSQDRLGRGGRLFRCYKFRTMRSDAEDVLRTHKDLHDLYLANDFKLPEGLDPRITKSGRFLRKTSLDELPQLWNVLKGDMSLVGPRPIVPDELLHYNGASSLLLSLRPGMTGKWAVGGRSGVTYPKRAGMELEYIRKWSVVGDLGILLRTGRVVLRGRGAH